MGSHETGPNADAAPLAQVGSHETGPNADAAPLARIGSATELASLLREQGQELGGKQEAQFMELQKSISALTDNLQTARARTPSTYASGWQASHQGSASESSRSVTSPLAWDTSLSYSDPTGAVQRDLYRLPPILPRLMPPPQLPHPSPHPPRGMAGGVGGRAGGEVGVEAVKVAMDSYSEMVSAQMHLSRGYLQEMVHRLLREQACHIAHPHIRREHVH